jgi:uncharacterized protein YjbJ (UPF0337 family)
VLRGDDTMTWSEIEEHWPHLTPQAQAKWAKLTPLDLAIVGGDRDRLIGKLEKRYGLPRADGEQHVDEWSGYEAKRPSSV